MKDLNKKTIIVTGAAGLLGRCFARKFAEYGAKLILADVQEEVLAIKDELGGKKVLAFCTDLTKPESWHHIIESAKKKDFKPNVLINNACVKSSHFFEPFESYLLKDWDEVMKVNLQSYMLGAQSIGPDFVRSGGGSIINVASIYGVLGPDQRIYDGAELNGVSINTPAIYSTSKAAVIGLTKYLSTYWGRNSIRVNSISPGGIKSGQNDKFVANYSSRVPLQRMADVHEIFGPVAFLASDLSSYITGQNLMVDGGLSVW